MSKIKVSFFGSSEFSIPTLKCLLEDNNIEVKSIITMPPAEKNRGKKMSNNVVQDFAIQQGFNEKMIFTPNSLKKKDNDGARLLEILKQQDLDFIVVVAYGKIITKSIIELPKYEILNLHPSALPKYRGAAPIERAIENGDKETEICIMKVDTGLDTGDVAFRQKYIFDEKKGANEIVPEIAEIGAKLMLETIKKCIKNEVIFTKQSEEGMIYANKIEKSELFIDLEDKTLDATKIFNKIRAFNNNGCCYFILNGMRVKIINATLDKHLDENKYGFDKTTGNIYLNGGIIKPIMLQKEGKKPMQLKDFLNGLK